MVIYPAGFITQGEALQTHGCMGPLDRAAGDMDMTAGLMDRPAGDMDRTAGDMDRPAGPLDRRGIPGTIRRRR